jgi:hypothetical protein
MTLPAVPTGFTVAPDFGPPPTPALLLSWTDASPSPSGFKIFRRRVTAPSTNFALLFTTSIGVSSYKDKTTLGNVTYEYHLVAYNAGPNGDAAPTADVQQLTLPAKPKSLQAIAPTGGNPRRGRTEIDLTWVDASDISTDMKIEMSSNLGVSWTQIVTNPANDFSFTATGLLEDHEYWFRIRGTNATGDGDYSDIAKVRTLPAPPTAPTTLTAITISDSSIKLTWVDTSGNEDKFRIQRVKGTNFSTGTDLTVQFAPRNVTAFLDTGLEPDTRYTYRVFAENTGGQSPASANAGATTGPPAPSNLTATVQSPTSVRLQFRDNATTETGFRIERKVGSGNFQKIASLPASAGSGATVSYTDNTAVTGQVNTYRVRAENTSGPSAYTAQVSVTP